MPKLRKMPKHILSKTFVRESFKRNFVLYMVSYFFNGSKIIFLVNTNHLEATMLFFVNTNHLEAAMPTNNEYLILVGNRYVLVT